MAQDNVTKWILDLVDRVTAPAKKVTKSVDGITDAIEEVTDAVQFNEKETKEALKNSQKHYNDLKGKIKQVEKEVNDLEKASKNAAPGKAFSKAKRDFEQAKKRLESLREELKGAEKDLKDLTKRSEEFKRSAKGWDDIATGINQTIETVDRLSQSLDFTTNYADLKVQIERMTDLSGKELDKVTDKAYKLGKIFKENPEELARAANALTQHVGGSIESNLDLIEKGFEKGANINGDFLDQLREYPNFFKELGLTGEEAIAMIAKAGKKAIFSDKAIDSLKEAQMSITELTPAAIDALKGIKLKPKDLEGLTAFEAIQKVSANMIGKSAQDKQRILADIFKGAGEDAGRAWVEGYASIDLNLDNIKSVETANKGLKSFIADIETTLGGALGGVGDYLDIISSSAVQIMGLISIFNTASTAIKGMTTAQWSLNAAMVANPIGIIIAAIVALIAYIAVALYYYDEFGAAMLQWLGPIGWVINGFQAIYDHWDSIVKAFKDGGIIAGLNRIRIVLHDAILKPLQQILELISSVDPTGLADKALSKVNEIRERDGLVTDREKRKEWQASDERKGYIDAMNAHDAKNKGVNLNNYTAPKLSYSAEDEKNKKGSKSNDGMSISGKSGAANIRMTINNYFTVGSNIDIRKVADQVAGRISDRLQDAVVTI